MRILLFISLFICWTRTYGQLDKLKGTWISPAQELVSINDTVARNNSNHLSNAQLEDHNFELFLYHDTLSFQSRHTSSGDKYLKIHTDRYDLKIIRLTETTLEVKPVSDLSRKFFQNKIKLVFTKQQFTVDTAVNFEKIIFHTTRCRGGCSVYHIAVDKSKSVLLHAAEVYSRNHRRDTTSEGYFTGKLSDSSFHNLLTALKTCNLQTLRMNNVLCCDGVVYTIIVYYNGQRKYFKTMTPPPIAYELIRTLRAIGEEKNLTKVTDAFELEK